MSTLLGFPTSEESRVLEIREPELVVLATFRSRLLSLLEAEARRDDRIVSIETTSWPRGSGDPEDPFGLVFHGLRVGIRRDDTDEPTYLHVSLGLD